jgi:hypothetical protein
MEIMYILFLPIFPVAPGAPEITAQPMEAIREGEFVNFRCESTGGNPPPRFQWLFENKSRVPESWHHEKVETPRGQSISSLQ